MEGDLQVRVTLLLEDVELAADEDLVILDGGEVEEEEAVGEEEGWNENKGMRLIQALKTPLHTK